MVVGEEPGEGVRLGHAELIDEPAGAGGADAVEESEHPVPRQLVARVLEDAQQAQQVLDVRALEELQAAVLDEGDVAAGQLELEPVAVVTGAEQHRLLVQRDSSLALLEHALAHERGLGQLVDARGERGRLPAGLVARSSLL